MSVAIITGSSGLIGSEAARFFHSKGMDIVGIDNGLRSYFFGATASTDWNRERLQRELNNYTHCDADIRNQDLIYSIFKKYGKDISAVVHTAAQPSHDWAAREPLTDFGINAVGTLVMLEATRQFCPTASFIFTSTNKVYGDLPNKLPLVELDTRYEIDPNHLWAKYGIDESMSLDQCKHSVFGASKVAADVMVQEYGRYFGLNTMVKRGGCLTGPSHSGAELHGFLSYLVKCAISEKEYTIYGYKGKQVRDNIHAADLVSAFWEYFKNPKPGRVYNMGGSRFSNCSVLEAIARIESISGKSLKYTITEQPRIGDHIWYISDVRRFQQDYPQWKLNHNLDSIIHEIVDAYQK